MEFLLNLTSPLWSVAMVSIFGGLDRPLARNQSLSSPRDLDEPSDHDERDDVLPENTDDPPPFFTAPADLSDTAWERPMRSRGRARRMSVPGALQDSTW